MTKQILLDSRTLYRKCVINRMRPYRRRWRQRGGECKKNRWVRGPDTPTGLEIADALRLGVNNALWQVKPPKPNLTFQQQKTTRGLKGDTRIMQILEDEKYQPVNWDPTLKVKRKTISTLRHIQDEGLINVKPYDHLIPLQSPPPNVQPS